MSYSIVENGTIKASGLPRPKRVGNTFIGSYSDVREFGYYPEVGAKPDTGPFEKAVIDTATLDGDVVRLTYRVERLPPPDEVTMRQARLALRQSGLLSSVDAAIASLPEPAATDAAIEWEYSQSVVRTQPFTLTLAGALGLSESDLDDLFRFAATL